MDEVGEALSTVEWDMPTLIDWLSVAALRCFYYFHLFGLDSHSE